MEPLIPELTSDRLLLRLPDERDIDAITEACQDPEVSRWTTVPVPYERSHAEGFVSSRRDAWNDPHGELTFAVTDRATGRLLGMVGLHASDASMREIGYWTAPWARGRGVTTEAAWLLCRFAFDVLKLQRVEWWANVGNDPSWRVAEKVGFRREGMARARLLQRGLRVDGWIAGLLPEDLVPAVPEHLA